ACRMDRARSAAIAWRRKIGRAAPSVAGGCLPPTARGAQGSRQARGAEPVWHLLPGRPDTQPSTGSCSQERVHGTGFAGPRDHGRAPCGVGVTASALATGVLYAVPTVVWGAIAWRHWSYVRLRRPRSLGFRMLPLMGGAFTAHYALLVALTLAPLGLHDDPSRAVESPIAVAWHIPWL